MGCRVSLFMDADVLAHTDAALTVRDLGADRVELYTEPYAAAAVRGGEAWKRSLELYGWAATRATAGGAGSERGA